MSRLTPCGAGLRVSSFLYGWLLRRISSIKEETVTDWFLDRMGLLCSRMHFKQWSRMAEGRTTGADFDWIIQFRTHHWKLRVQAKCLRDYKNVSANLRHPKDRGEQIRLLIRSAVADSYFPTYAFYTALTATCRVRVDHQESVYLASGLDIFKRFYRKGQIVTATHLMGRSFPLAFILCDALVRAAHSSSGPGTWLFEEPLAPKVSLGRFRVEIPNELGLGVGIHPLAPELVGAERPTVAESYDDQSVQAYFSNYPHVSRIAVLDLREAEGLSGDIDET